jgi:hypothetical protein
MVDLSLSLAAINGRATDWKRSVTALSALSLGTRPIRNPNLARAHHQELAAGELSSGFLDHGIEVFDFGLQGRTWQPEEEDAGMGEALVENQLSEFAVGNDQNAFLPPGDRQHVLIVKAGREVVGNG